MRDASSRATKAFSGDVHVRSDFLRRFERRPRLTVAIVEFELAWVYLSRAPRRGDLPVQGSDTPERFLPPQRGTGFQEDAIGIRLRDVIGLDNMMWGSDCTRCSTITIVMSGRRPDPCRIVRPTSPITITLRSWPELRHKRFRSQTPDSASHWNY